MYIENKIMSQIKEQTPHPCKYYSVRKCAESFQFLFNAARPLKQALAWLPVVRLVSM